MVILITKFLILLSLQCIIAYSNIFIIGLLHSIYKSENKWQKSPNSKADMKKSTVSKNNKSGWLSDLRWVLSLIIFKTAYYCQHKVREILDI